MVYPNELGEYIGRSENRAYPQKGISMRVLCVGLSNENEAFVSYSNKNKKQVNAMEAKHVANT